MDRPRRGESAVVVRVEEHDERDTGMLEGGGNNINNRSSLADGDNNAVPRHEDERGAPAPTTLINEPDQLEDHSSNNKKGDLGDDGGFLRDVYLFAPEAREQLFERDYYWKTYDDENVEHRYLLTRGKIRHTTTALCLFVAACYFVMALTWTLPYSSVFYAHITFATFFILCAFMNMLLMQYQKSEVKEGTFSEQKALTLTKRYELLTLAVVLVANIGAILAGPTMEHCYLLRSPSATSTHTTGTSVATMTQEETNSNGPLGSTAAAVDKMIPINREAAQSCLVLVFPYTILLQITAVCFVYLRPVFAMPALVLNPILFLFSTLLLRNREVFRLCWVPNHFLPRESTLVANELVSVPATIAFCVGLFVLDSQRRRDFESWVRLQRHQKRLDAQKKTVDDYLETLLPPGVASQLTKENAGFSSSRECVVAVTQIFNSSQWSTELLPELMVVVLDHLFCSFDEELSTGFPSLLKVKTVGDKYIVCSTMQMPRTGGSHSTIVEYVVDNGNVERVGTLSSASTPSSSSSITADGSSSGATTVGGNDNISHLRMYSHQTVQNCFAVVEFALFQLKVAERARRRVAHMLGISPSPSTRSRQDSNLALQVGLHLGACCSSVIGSHSLRYELFGEGLQVALELANASAANSLRMSSTVQELLSLSLFSALSHSAAASTGTMNSSSGGRGTLTLEVNQLGSSPSPFQQTMSSLLRASPAAALVLPHGIAGEGTGSGDETKLTEMGGGKSTAGIETEVSTVFGIPGFTRNTGHQLLTHEPSFHASPLTPTFMIPTHSPDKKKTTNAGAKGIAAFPTATATRRSSNSSRRQQRNKNKNAASVDWVEYAAPADYLSSGTSAQHYVHVYASLVNEQRSQKNPTSQDQNQPPSRQSFTARTSGLVLGSALQPGVRSIPPAATTTAWAEEANQHQRRDVSSAFSAPFVISGESEGSSSELVGAAVGGFMSSADRSSEDAAAPTPLQTGGGCRTPPLRPVVQGTPHDPQSSSSSSLLESNSSSQQGLTLIGNLPSPSSRAACGTGPVPVVVAATTSSLSIRTTAGSSSSGGGSPRGSANLSNSNSPRHYPMHNQQQPGTVVATSNSSSNRRTSNSHNRSKSSTDSSSHSSARQRQENILQYVQNEANLPIDSVRPTTVSSSAGSSRQHSQRRVDYRQRSSHRRSKKRSKWDNGGEERDGEYNRFDRTTGIDDDDDDDEKHDGVLVRRHRQKSVDVTPLSHSAGDGLQVACDVDGDCGDPTELQFDSESSSSCGTSDEEDLAATLDAGWFSPYAPAVLVETVSPSANATAASPVVAPLPKTESGNPPLLPTTGTATKTSALLVDEGTEHTELIVAGEVLGPGPAALYRAMYIHSMNSYGTKNSIGATIFLLALQLLLFFVVSLEDALNLESLVLFACGILVTLAWLRVQVLSHSDFRESYLIKKNGTTDTPSSEPGSPSRSRRGSQQNTPMGTPLHPPSATGAAGSRSPTLPTQSEENEEAERQGNEHDPHGDGRDESDNNGPGLEQTDDAGSQMMTEALPRWLDVAFCVFLFTIPRLALHFLDRHYSHVASDDRFLAILLTTIATFAVHRMTLFLALTLQCYIVLLHVVMSLVQHHGDLPLDYWLVYGLLFLIIAFATTRTFKVRAQFYHSIAQSQFFVWRIGWETVFQRQLLHMVVPQRFVRAVMEKSAGRRHECVFDTGDISIAMLRFDRFAELSLNPHIEEAPLRALSELRRLFSAIDEAISNCECVNKVETVQTLGDEVAIAGPLDERPKKFTGAQALSGPWGVMHNPRKVSEDMVFRAARSLIFIIRWLFFSLRSPFTFVLHMSDASVAIMGSRRPTVNVIGHAVRTGQALLSALPVNMSCMTESFRALLDAKDYCILDALNRPMLDVRRKQRFRLKGVGILYAHPTSIPLYAEE